MNQLEVYDLGLSPYHEMWELQRAVQKQLIDQKMALRENPDAKKTIPDALLLVEHPHVYTLGKSGDSANLLRTSVELKDIEAEFIEIDRGGDITYHGPGQIVGYPILDLDRHFTDIHKYLRFLEEVIIRTCAEYGLKGERLEGLTGVWVNGSKVCAMGIRCSRWVTMHGFALNVNTNLDYFNHIVPCGITDKSVSSLSVLTGSIIDENEVREKLLRHFADVFNVEIVIKDSIQEREPQITYLIPSN